MAKIAPVTTPLTEAHAMENGHSGSATASVKFPQIPMDLEKKLIAANANTNGVMSASANGANGLHHPHYRVSNVQIALSVLSFLISSTDVFIILYISYQHFRHNSDLLAWLMLLPILLNFIGIFTFLSDTAERKEMESFGGDRWKDWMFFPVLGPAFSALRLLYRTLKNPADVERHERFESLLTRMKQYESFFRAAPEAFVQITFRIITWSADKQFLAEDYWVSLCITLCIFTLAESNMYAPVVPYYQMFHRERGPDAWKISHIPMKWRLGLFFFSYFSVGSRILADAVLKASACFLFAEESFGEVIIITFLGQFVLRAVMYDFFNKIVSKSEKLQIADEGVYEAFTYSWRSLFLSFDFASQSKWIFFWFYGESLIMIGISYAIVLSIGVNLSDKPQYHRHAALSVTLTLLAVCLKFALRYRWKKRAMSLESANNIGEKH